MILVLSSLVTILLRQKKVIYPPSLRFSKSSITQGLIKYPKCKRDIPLNLKNNSDSLKVYKLNKDFYSIALDRLAINNIYKPYDVLDKFFIKLEKGADISYINNITNNIASIDTNITINMLHIPSNPIPNNVINQHFIYINTPI